MQPFGCFFKEKMNWQSILLPPLLFKFLEQRGDHFTSELFKAGLLSIAKEYVRRTLPLDQKTRIEGSS
jgi:hypothetical protein